MNLPTFDEKGNISMSEVLNAELKDFEAFGVNVVERLDQLQQELAAADSNTYSKSKSDIIHNHLSLYETKESRLRQGQLSALFCFYYTFYNLLLNGNTYCYMDESDIQKMDFEILDCEIRRVKNPYSFYGRSNEKFIDSYKGKVVTIPKGCPIKTNGKMTMSKKTYNIVIGHVLQGHYYRGVHHPSMRWGGRDGWNEALFKDVFKET